MIQERIIKLISEYCTKEGEIRREGCLIFDTIFNLCVIYAWIVL